MKKYVSADNLDKVFELISGGTVHKKDPIILIDGQQINLGKLLLDIIQYTNRNSDEDGLSFGDYVIDNIKYTISVNVDNKKYYLYPLYDYNVKDKKSCYCIYAFSTNILENGKIYKNIKQEPVRFISDNGDTWESYMYLIIGNRNKDFSEYLNNDLSKDFIPNNFMFCLSNSMKSSDELVSYYNSDVVNTEDGNKNFLSFDEIKNSIPKDIFDFDNNHISFINTI